jgi:hypothetical protein
VRKGVRRVLAAWDLTFASAGAESLKRSSVQLEEPALPAPRKTDYEESIRGAGKPLAASVRIT